VFGALAATVAGLIIGVPALRIRTANWRS